MEIVSNNSTITEPVFACILQRIVCQESHRSSNYYTVVVSIMFNLLFALTAVLGNGLMLAAYYQSESLRKPVHTILLNLAVTDFLTGAVSQPLYIYELLLHLANCTEKICVARSLKKFPMAFLTGATLLNLSLTTLDRYIAILHSCRYVELVTNNRVIKLSVGLWLGWIILFIAGALSSTELMITTVLMASSVIFISILYFKIFREICRLETSMAVVAANEPEEVRKARERKTAKTIAMILGLLVLCFIPVIIAYFLIFGLSLSGNGNSYNIIKLKCYYFTNTLIFSNSSLNVIVYFWKSAEIKTAILKVIRTVTRCCRNELNP